MLPVLISLLVNNSPDFDCHYIAKAVLCIAKLGLCYLDLEHNAKPLFP